jgi:hypothetical protein
MLCRGIILAATAAALIGGGWAISAGDAQAASGSQRECEAAGGTYTKSGPDSICVYPEEKVSNPNASPNNNAQTTQKTDTGQGNLGNKTESECVGPPGQCK